MSANISSIPERLIGVRQEITSYCKQIDRDPKTVELLAVSKGRRDEEIEQAYACGQRDFGENYWQELSDKQQRLTESDIVWHFIGRLQSRKARALANRVDWLHSLSRIKIAHKLNLSRSREKAPLNVCLQVNLFGETQKDGIPPEAVGALAHKITALDRLRLRGLMTILPLALDTDQQFRAYSRLRQLQSTLQAEGIKLDSLSMGMSRDWRPAIAAGSTIVRLGTAVFGDRAVN